MQHMFNICQENNNGVNVVYNPKSAAIHVLEVDNGFKCGLTDCMEGVRGKIQGRIEEYGHSCSELHWFLYDMDGKVTLLQDGAKQVVTLTHPELYAPFAAKMKLRLAVGQGQR